MNTNAASRVLVVEDERKISDLLLNYLRAEGYEATPAYDGRDAVQQIVQHAPDVVVLDWMLPGLDGIGVCKAVRAFSDVPILMLTARVDELDRLLGLNTGADDYVCKPFAPREVVARVRALLRRAGGRVITLPQPWLVEDATFRISWLGHWLPLTRIEFMVFRTLLARPGRVFSRAQLLSACTKASGTSVTAPSTPTLKTCAKKCRRLTPAVIASPRFMAWATASICRGEATTGGVTVMERLLIEAFPCLSEPTS